MRYPINGVTAQRELTASDFSGGLNTRETGSAVADNQLTDCLNMWYRDGLLTTRPSIRAGRSSPLSASVSGGAPIKRHEVYVPISENGRTESCRLVSFFAGGNICFYLVGENILRALPEIPIGVYDYTYFAASDGDWIYCYVSNGSVFKFREGDEKFTKVADTDFYIPLVISDGTMLESFNALTPYYRVKFSSYNNDNRIKDADGDDASIVTFTLPEKPVVGTTITLKRTDSMGVEHICEIEYAGGNVSSGDEDGKVVKIYGSGKIIYYEADTGKYFYEKKDDYVKANIEVTATFDNSKLKRRCLSFTKSIEFGGGLSGGTRLFLGGNTQQKNLVAWSGLNDPLYLPENNYFYVGSAGSSVTAFGKQSDMLVIFKENETYFTKYQQNTDITAEDLINQNVVDYMASSVYFPLTLINATVGCDCPETVELCRNRLVWANSTGKVYTLVSSDRYSERNIFEVGLMISGKLKSEANLKGAYSADWNGFYLLQAGTATYLLDYNSEGYQNVSAFSKSADANRRIPWYFGEFPSELGENICPVATGEKLGIINFSSEGFTVSYADAKEDTDEIITADGVRKITIESSVKTKLFDFSAEGYFKNIDSIILNVRAGETPISVDYISDAGCATELVAVPSGLDGDENYIAAINRFVGIKGVLRFGIRIKCRGRFGICGLNIIYRITGGAK